MLHLNYWQLLLFAFTGRLGLLVLPLGLLSGSCEAGLASLAATTSQRLRETLIASVVGGVVIGHNFGRHGKAGLRWPDLRSLMRHFMGNKLCGLR